MDDNRTLKSLTTEIVSAYLAGNRITAGELPPLIQAVSRTLTGLGEPQPAADAPMSQQSPARIRRSITPEGLVSFEDGKSYKHLKRHLRAMNLSPDQYRAKWGLPAKYPMVSANYSAQRSEIAKATGLGRTSKRPELSEAPVNQAEGKPSATPTKPRIAGRLGLFGKRKTAT
jgi:predicted transcriptional regulator